jgi:hypothetical protein
MYMFCDIYKDLTLYITFGACTDFHKHLSTLEPSCVVRICPISKIDIIAYACAKAQFWRHNRVHRFHIDQKVCKPF